MQYALLVYSAASMWALLLDTGQDVCEVLDFLCLWSAIVKYIPFCSLELIGKFVLVCNHARWTYNLVTKLLTLSYSDNLPLNNFLQNLI